MERPGGWSTLALEAQARLRAAEGDGQNFRLEPAPAAGVARLRVHETFQPVPGEFAFAFDVKAFQIGNDALKRLFAPGSILPARQKVNSISSAPVPRSSFCLKSSGKSFHGVSRFCP